MKKKQRTKLTAFIAEAPNGEGVIAFMTFNRAPKGLVEAIKSSVTMNSTDDVTAFQMRGKTHAYIRSSMSIEVVITGIESDLARRKIMAGMTVDFTASKTRKQAKACASFPFRGKELVEHINGRPMLAETN